MTARPRPTVEVLASPDELARHVARELVDRIRALQAAGRVPSVVLTGGTIADAVHRAVLDVPGHAQVDWSAVEIWFGDERFVPATDDDRNALQSRAALLDHVPVDPARVHEMPASDSEYAGDPDAAAAAYADELVGVLGAPPRFDVLMLGVGPDGHCASLFPGHAAVGAEGLTVAVRDSPKPPPTRISLTMGALMLADEVWFVGSGEGKAAAVHDALTTADVDAVPASGPQGRLRTTWFLDAGAASRPDPA